MSGPLTGIRVVDLSSVVMGPLATGLLADLGADVVKVEPPEGDGLRHAGYLPEPLQGPLYEHLNRGKQLVVADLGTPEGREVVRELCRTADVFSTNIRPAALARAGLDYDVLAADNPRLVYLSMVGFGSGGPKAGLAAYDDLMQAEAGLAWAIGATSDDGDPRYVPFNLCDRMVGVYAFGCINAALVARERTGLGQHVEVPMFETMTALVMGEHLNGRTYDPPTGPTGYQRIMNKVRRPYRTSDGWVSSLVYTPQQWRRFCALVGADGRPTGGVEAEQAFLSAEFRQRTTADWVRTLMEIDVPVAQLNSFDDLVDDEHLDAVGFWKSVDGIRTPGVPSRWSATPPGPISRAPRLPNN